MTELLVDFGLRLAKIGLALFLGVIVYVVLTGPVGVAGSAELALLSFLTGAAAVLLFEGGIG